MGKKKRQYDEVSYWESMADGIVALLLLVLLILMMVILLLVHIPDEDYVDLFRGDQYEEYRDAEAGGGQHNNSDASDEPGDQWEEEESEDGAGGTHGGGGETGEGGEGGQEYEDPDPGAGDGTGVDRAAVFVQVVDGETGRTIKLKGIQFELYGANSALQVLSTYYPKRIDYKLYETDESGVFYLPEKVPLEEYYLHQLSGLPGYDISENTSFLIDRAYDWNDPYVVTVPLYPAKNAIEIQLLDKGNGQAVSGASFDVIAAENIVTQDGTTRYKEGDVVDNIAVDEKGMGTSRELFLGKYTLRQNEVPELYARLTQDYSVTIEERTEAEKSAVTQITQEKTSLRVQLTDALYDTTYLAGAKYTITNDDGQLVERVTTDEKGRFTVTNLKKNTTYHVQQESTIGDYQLDNADHTVPVSSDGLINGAAQGQLALHNRVIRVSISVRDQLFRGQVSDVHVSLWNDMDQVVKSWNTSGMDQMLTGLAPGRYKVVLSGDEDNANEILVEDMTDIQSFQFFRITTADIGAVIGAIIVLVGLIFVTRLLLLQRKQNKAEGGEQ